MQSHVYADILEKTHMRFVILVMVLFTALLSTKTQADSSQCPLTGLSSLCSTVDMDGPDNKPGLTYSTYQNMVNQRLREESLYSDRPEGLLTFGITTQKTQSGKKFVVVVVALLFEQINLHRAGSKLVSVASWNDYACQIADSDHVGALITDCINTIMDTFESDYHKDNPPSTLIPSPLPIATPTPAKSSK